MRYHFGPFVADRVAYRLLQDGTAIELTPKSLDVLFFLLDRPAALVTKEALLDGVWPSANVTENALAQAMSDLRDALGDRASSPTYIRTVARRGYRFIAPVEPRESQAPSPPRAAAPDTAARATIAVLDFVNVTNDPEVAWLSAGIAETVTGDLAALARFRVIDRWRVVQAARAADGLHAIAAAVGASHAVVGSYQRAAAHLRITARIVDLATGEATADAKVDGPINSVFDLQDGIVAAFARELGAPDAGAGERIGVRETSSLDAYRAYVEGLVKIESLDTSLARASKADFERAIAYDSAYAMAYTGLANAEFIAYETSRTARHPDRAALESGIAHARRAVELDARLAEAHATLSFLLASDLALDEARAEAARAVALEPDSWRHQYRLGHALWGPARGRALERALALYPQFPYASFEIAMLLVARGDLAGAERLVRRRLDDQSRTTPADRFPAVGFHWLLGAIEAAGGRHEAAAVEFDRELAHATLHRLYGPEYRAEAWAGHGYAHLALGAPDVALTSFGRAIEIMPTHLRARIGEALALDAAGRSTDAHAGWQAAEAEAAAAATDGRPHQSHLAQASLAAGRGCGPEAVAALQAALDTVAPSPVGWTIPIDPLLARLRRPERLTPVLDRLRERAQ